jgi:hypothetical protein
VVIGRSVQTPVRAEFAACNDAGAMRAAGEPVSERCKAGPMPSQAESVIQIRSKRK